ncbi:MAG: hypothetical protein AABX65_03245 [Nanoarchaeota archaeon]
MPAFIRREIYFGRPLSKNTNSSVIWEFSIEQDMIEWRVRKNSQRKLLAREEQFHKLERITPGVTQKQMDSHFSRGDRRKKNKLFVWGCWKLSCADKKAQRDGLFWRWKKSYRSLTRKVKDCMPL